MVGVEFITRRIALLQDHRREIWRHRARDDLRLHVSELNADAQEEVIRAFFSSAAIPAIPGTALPIYNLGARETSRVTTGILNSMPGAHSLPMASCLVLSRVHRRLAQSRTR
jgi:hypothetical protein